jgi:hypothetical protein
MGRWTVLRGLKGLVRAPVGASSAQNSHGGDRASLTVSQEQTLPLYLPSTLNGASLYEHDTEGAQILD